MPRVRPTIGRELSQAIPPAYTQFIGEQLMAAIGAGVVS